MIGKSFHVIVAVFADAFFPLFRINHKKYVKMLQRNESEKKRTIDKRAKWNAKASVGES